jgi:hypothetical protein
MFGLGSSAILGLGTALATGTAAVTILAVVVEISSPGTLASLFRKGGRK